MQKNVEDTPLYTQVKEVLKLPYGNFYFFKNFVISEINEGVTFNWEKAKYVIAYGEEFYGQKDYKANYISNRIYSYSVVPQDWMNFFLNRKSFKSFTIVTYRESSMINIMMEKLFYKKNITHKTSLLEAVNYVYSLENLPQVTSLLNMDTTKSIAKSC